MGFKDHIENLVKIAESDGLTVVLNSDKCIEPRLFREPKRCYGFIIFSDKVIHIAPNDDIVVLITLLHECGHWLGMKRSVQRYGHYSYQNIHHLKEIDAYKHGWYLIKHFNIPISKDAWRYAHKNEIVNYVKREGRKPIFTPRKMVEVKMEKSGEMALSIIIACMIVWTVIWLLVGFKVI